MKKIKFLFIALLALLSLLWFFSDTLLPAPLTYFTFRNVFIQFSGVIAIGLMSVNLILAIRPLWLERRLNGLDKMYRLHKWLGMTSFIVFTLHWWLAQGTRWMVDWGWLVRPERRPKMEVLRGPIEALFNSQRGLAKDVGQYVFYAVAVLLILALIKLFPYRLFAKTHTLLAAAYLALVFHAVMLIKFGYWSAPVGWVLACLMLAGSIAAILVLLRRVGANRKVSGKVQTVTYYPEVRVTETVIALQKGWGGHRAGQFAFVTSDKKEGAHPYTITSAWDPKNQTNPTMTFTTKALGDHTSRLPDYLKENLPVVIEGPYGCFTFDNPQPHQIWVGAGIGITPFIARMKELAHIPGQKNIDLFHSTTEVESAVIDKLKADAHAAGVRLHVLVDKIDGLLDGVRIRRVATNWEASSVWFCGPPGFGRSLRRDFVKTGLSPDNFHQELFEMR